MQWDYTTDFLVVGSGAGGMTAAIVAKELGGDSLVIEKTDFYGGTTALSGGVVWIPNNDSMKECGIADCEEDGLDYLREVVGPDVPEEKLRAYVQRGSEMIRFMGERTPVAYVAADRYADYYPELKGGKSGGRSMDPVPISRRKLGEEAKLQREPPWKMLGFMKFAVTVNESREMMDMSHKGTFYMIRNIIRYYLDIPSRLKGLTDNRLTLGKGLVANCRKAMMDRDIPLWLNSEAKKLIEEDGRVVGVQVLKDGKLINIKASKGVLLAAGGMGRNVEMRQEYGQLPTGEGWSSDSPGNVGDGIRMGLEVGAAVEFMGSAWWTPSVKTPDGVMMALISGKSMPGSFFVDGSGKRFCNEAAPYEDVIKEFWKNQARGIPTIPCYMVFDARFRHEYMAGPVAPGKVQPDAALPKEYLATGFLKKADSIEALSVQLGIEASELMKTVERHNQFAATGKDLDFGRGDSSHDRYYSDTSITPNPNLAPLVKAPYYAMEIYPGDLGTKGGLKFDSSARVLNQGNEVIEGLYVTGNCAGSVMGDSYPGAGSTIGPSMTFGYVAARHALNQ